MLRPHLIPLVASLFLLPACPPKTKPAQIFPGFESANPDRLSTIRESDNIYIYSIDRRNAPEVDNNLIGRRGYRQLQIPAGVHLISIYYRSTEESSVYSFVARLQESHTYSFNSKMDRPIISFSTKRHWHAQLIDDATGQPASTQPATAPASRP